MAKKKPVKTAAKKVTTLNEMKEQFAASLKENGVILSKVDWYAPQHCFRFCVDAKVGKGFRHVATIKLKVRNDGTYKLLIDPAEWMPFAAKKAGFTLDPVEKPAKKTAKKATKKAPRAPEDDTSAPIMPEEGRTSIPFPTDRG